MRRFLFGTCALIAILAVAASAAGAGKVASLEGGKGPMNTGFVYLSWGSPALDVLQFQRMYSAGARLVRISYQWSSIAPAGNEMPADFDPGNPADPHYNWTNLDTLIQEATGAGLQPILEIHSAPVWAQGTASNRPLTGGGYKPSVAAFGTFMSAAATRYSGSFATGTYSTILPRVRYWAIWNEPNLRKYLSPQVVGQKAVAPATYRALLNAGANAVHGVAASNVVIGGETSPFGAPPSQRARPLKFMEQVLCVSDKPDKRVNGAWTYKYKSACKTKVKFDIWSQHPYTEGGPTVKANTHGDLPLGNMSDMRDVLNTAVRANHVVAPHGVRLWITEFSWDSKPPDPGGVPTALEARWVSQTLYQLWKTGVSMLTWFIVRDQPYPDSFYQSGLYTYSPGNSDDPTLDRPKPALTAFRFPFVAVPVSKAAATIWGRTPDSSWTVSRSSASPAVNGNWSRRCKRTAPGSSRRVSTRPARRFSGPA